jgi:hypothetical protein
MDENIYDKQQYIKNKQVKTDFKKIFKKHFIFHLHCIDNINLRIVSELN